jgi:hypothetical protein
LHGGFIIVIALQTDELGRQKVIWLFTHHKEASALVAVLVADYNLLLDIGAATVIATTGSHLDVMRRMAACCMCISRLESYTNSAVNEQAQKKVPA